MKKLRVREAFRRCSPARPSGYAGFSLIELMIVVVVIGVLAAIAYPSYVNYLKRGYRSQAEQLMSNISSKEQQYFLDARAYTATIGSGGLNIKSTDVWTCAATCTNAHYTVSVTAPPAAVPPYFFVTATPQGNQVSDGTLYLNTTDGTTYSEGYKSRTAGDNKW